MSTPVCQGCCTPSCLRCSLLCCWVPLRALFASVNYCFSCLSCCPAPPEWSLPFAVAVAYLRATMSNLILNMRVYKVLSPPSIPFSSPMLPKDLKHRVASRTPTIPPGEWYWHSSLPDPTSTPPAKVLLYFHGGAYTLCSPCTHRYVTIQLLAALNKTSPDFVLFAVDYCKPPAHPYPEPSTDCALAYTYLLVLGHPLPSSPATPPVARSSSKLSSKTTRATHPSQQPAT